MTENLHPTTVEHRKQQRRQDMANIRELVEEHGVDHVVKGVDTELLEQHFPWLEILRNLRNEEQAKLDNAQPGGFDLIMPNFADDTHGRVQAWKDAYTAAVRAILTSDLW